MRREILTLTTQGRASSWIYRRHVGSRRPAPLRRIASKSNRHDNSRYRRRLGNHRLHRQFADSFRKKVKVLSNTRSCSASWRLSLSACSPMTACIPNSELLFKVSPIVSRPSMNITAAAPLTPKTKMKIKKAPLAVAINVKHKKKIFKQVIGFLVLRRAVD